MKFLLDEMWSKRIGEQLRQRGLDVEAVGERPELMRRPDHEIWDTAQREDRAVVTDNARDFRPLAAATLRAGHVHAGLVLTDNHSLPRAHPRTAGRVVRALEALMTSDPDLRDLEYWLR